MQNYSTIIGIIDMRQRCFSKEDAMRRFGKGSSTVQLIMDIWVRE